MAKEKMAAIVVLPFHKRWIKVNGEEEVESVGHGWRGVNQRVLKSARCSVAVLVDRGFGGDSQMTPGPRPPPNSVQNVCVMFFGGPDDREGLELGGRMAEHPAVEVEVMRFAVNIESNGDAATLRPSPRVSRQKSHTFTTAITITNPQAERVTITDFSEYLPLIISLLKHLCSNYSLGA